MADLTLNWPYWIQPSAGLPVVQWSLLLAVAAAAGHMLQRHMGLPKVLGYCVIGALAGLGGFDGASWPLEGVGLFLIELGLSVMLFEAGGRLTFRWLRHDPMLLLQSLCESVATFAAVYGVLGLLEVDPKLLAPLSLVAMAASPAVLMRVAADLRASGPVTDRSIALASLNTLYVLPLGGAMARYLGQAELSLTGVAYPVAVLLGVSVAFGAVLALTLRITLRGMSPVSENTSVVLLALVASCTTLAANFGGSAPLTALLAGVLLKALHPRPWSWPRQFGTAASMLTILMLVLVSLVAAQADWSMPVFSLVAAMALTRAVVKLAAIGMGSFGSGASVRQAIWTGCALWPMSAVALLLVSQFCVLAPEIGAKIAALALPLILLTELLGALLCTLALLRTGEASASMAQQRAEPPGELIHDA